MFNNGSYMTFGNLISEFPDSKNVILDTKMLFLYSL